MTSFDQDPAKADVRKLSQMMGLGTEHGRIWHSDELAAILRHQLNAPVQVDLGAFDPAQAERLRQSTTAMGLLLRSFGDLFFHPHPPVELLELTKQFGKACRTHPQSPLPHEIAMLIYIASIVTARLRCGRKISELDDRGLRERIDWLLRQPWLEERVRALLEEGRRDVGG